APNVTTPAPPATLGVSTSPVALPQSPSPAPALTPVAPPTPVAASESVPQRPAPKKRPVAPPTVDQRSQAIVFTSTAPADAPVGGGPYALSASASSGLAVTYSTSAGSADVCHLVNRAVWFVSAGTCRIYADQAGDAVYLAAPQAQQWFTVGLVPQTIAFTSTPP